MLPPAPGQTAAFCRSVGARQVGILATEGTIASGAYHTALEAEGVGYMTCTPEEQRIVSDIIYGQIKKGLPPDLAAFSGILNHMRERGCERVILGCTELSLLKEHLKEGFLIDALEVLALSAIRLCGKQPTGFPDELMKFKPTKGKKLCC